MPAPNLVQIQRDLQMLPPGPQTMMYLKRAKDGMVASVPPYLAAAELAGREKMAQRQALSDGAAQGEQPTVSQQLSQKADLLALQAMKKQAMDRQGLDQARGAVMPAPEGSPEPEEQPRREGGLDRLPVEFGFEGGGIVAFEAGGDADKKKKKRPSMYGAAFTREDPLIAQLYPQVTQDVDMAALPQGAAGDVAGGDFSSAQAQIAAQRAGSALATPGAAALDVAMLPYSALKSLTTHGGASITPYMDEVRKREALAAAAEKQAAQPGAAISPEVLAAYGPNAPRMPQVQTPAPGAQQRPPAPPAPPQQRPPAPAPTAPQAAAPAQPGAQQPTTADLRTALMSGVGLAGAPAGAAAAPQAAAPQSGLAQAGTDVKALAAAMGLGTPAGAEERELIAQMRARHAQQEKDRARMGLKAVLGGFSRGYGGAAASEQEFAQRAYAEDMQHQQQMYNLINAINTGNRKEAEGIFNKAMSIGEAREKDVAAMERTREQEAGAMSRSKLQALSQMYSAELQAGSSKYNTDGHVRVALMQADRAAKSNDLQERKLAVDGLQSAERGIQSELTKLQGLMDPQSRKRRGELEKDLTELRTRISALSGADQRAPAPAAGTTPTTATQGRVLNWADIK